jgi:hypothetical protein
MMTLLLLVGLTGSAMAYTDATGDSTGAIDLLSANVTMYPPSSGTDAPDFIRLDVETDSQLPGLIIFDFDTDHNDGTGSGSILNMPFPPCPPTRCKTCEGYEFYVVLALRDQGDTANISYCKGCIGTPTCVTRDNPATCDEGTCYEPVDDCVIGDPDCWVLSTQEPCNNCTPNGTPRYVLDTPCGLESDYCGEGLQYGEWYVQKTGVGGGGGAIITRGRVELPGASFQSFSEYSFHLPWAEILARAAQNGALPDYNFAIANPPKYQVSIWYDSVFTDKDDLFDAGLVLNLNDYLPNADCEKAEDGAVGAQLCLADTNGDCKVNLTDLVQIKSEFLRNDCPNCTP